jgi:ribulose-phosphate 3-epimerase
LDYSSKRLQNVTKAIHLDIADGKFAPNKVLQFKFKLDQHFEYSAHLMILNPLPWIKKNLSKINLFIPHVETIDNLSSYVQFMKKNQKKIAFAILPETKISIIKEYLKAADYILVLTVHPGFYGSKYLPKELKKIPQIKKVNPKIKIIVDGGMNPKTINSAKRAGSDYFISGSYTTKAKDPKKAIKSLMDAIRK